MKHTELYEQLVKEWSPKNERPLDSYKSYSKEYGLWVCSEGHEWPATIKGRFSRHGCPFCGGKRPVAGENDAATLCPELVSEWHPKLNGTKKLSDFGRGSEYKAWWKCGKGHIWPAAVNHRVNGEGCPYCRGKIPHKDYNLATVLPHVAALWNYEKNAKKPEEYCPHSRDFVMWKCEKGHEWPATIHSMSRIRTTNGCPYCYGRLPIKGETDLATLRPELVAEWDWKKNRKDPSQYGVFANKKVLWICPRGHSYPAFINNRAKGDGCPLCNRGWKS
ncbi:MAG: zinc-ribbon domain-containing protein [Lachnospiraceae bacterium]|nr:zinc-ribbon domain-containing protein [Lachnospiraceae bacterium]